MRTNIWLPKIQSRGNPRSNAASVTRLASSIAFAKPTGLNISPEEQARNALVKSGPQ